MKTTRLRLAATALAAAALATAAVLPANAADATAVPACGNHAIAISATGAQGATGHGDLVLRFRNASTSTCSLTGYPGVDALNANRHVITSAKRTKVGFTGGSKQGVRTIVVHPGRYASADLEWHNFNYTTSGDCLFSHYLDVTAANTVRVVRLARQVSVCGLQIHPTVAGITGDS